MIVVMAAQVSPLLERWSALCGPLRRVLYYLGQDDFKALKAALEGARLPDSQSRASLRDVISEPLQLAWNPAALAAARDPVAMEHYCKRLGHLAPTPEAQHELLMAAIAVRDRAAVRMLYARYPYAEGISRYSEAADRVETRGSHCYGLEAAASNGDTQMVRLLRTKGPIDTYEQALCNAAKAGSWYLVKLFIGIGARDIPAALGEAAGRGQANTVQRLLALNPCGINRALVRAARSNSLECMQLLHDTQLTTTLGISTALVYAASEGHPPAVEKCLHWMGPTPQKGMACRFACQFAAANGRAAVMDYLVRAGLPAEERKALEENPQRGLNKLPEHDITMYEDDPYYFGHNN